jgi:isoleucyl-tRNA synthetase
VASERLQLVPRELGPRLGGVVQDVIRAHKAGDWTLEGDVVTVGGHELLEGEYSLELVAGDDRASAGLPGNIGVIALDIDVTDELELEGRARDLIRLVQQARRAADLHVSDRIRLTVVAGPEWIGALSAHRDLVCKETLAVELRSTLNEQSPSADPDIDVARVDPG